MTNVRSSGFDSPSQFEEYLADIEPGEEVVGYPEIANDDEILRELAWLRRDVALLREQLATMRKRPLLPRR